VELGPPTPIAAASTTVSCTAYLHPGIKSPIDRQSPLQW